ncbi:MAG: electron transport complex subunit E [Thermodesulfobacteriota bacterium]|nr:electron transport complex subunit E [Thermodesulfobacteriota bacterium]
MAKTVVQEFTKGLWAEIPPFRLVLGLCPVLAVTTKVENGIGMGLATTFVLVGSNVLVSLLRNIIPTKVRIACFITIIATFVTLVELLMQAFTYSLFLQLGIFIPLIVVNCIVLGRAEAFASKNKLVPSIADGLGIGVGFTLSLAAIAAVREGIGAGTLTIFGNTFVPFGDAYMPFAFMVQAPGAFVCLGLMLSIMNMLEK